MTTGQRQLISLKQWAVREHLSDAMPAERMAGILGVSEAEILDAVAEHLEHVADCVGRVA